MGPKAKARIKKVLAWGGVAFLVFFAAYQPTKAAHVVKELGVTAVTIFDGIGDFFSSLTSS